VLRISGQSTFTAATLPCADHRDHPADWHSHGTVDCANQIRLHKPLISNGLRRRHNRRRRGGDSLNARLLPICSCSNCNHSSNTSVMVNGIVRSRSQLSSVGAATKPPQTNRSTGPMHVSDESPSCFEEVLFGYIVYGSSRPSAHRTGWPWVVRISPMIRASKGLRGRLSCCTLRLDATHLYSTRFTWVRGPQQLPPR
jgi:hypothetical protein